MEELYALIEKELNIDRETFDQIISDESAKQQICEALLYCLEHKPELAIVASLALQYIAETEYGDLNYYNVAENYNHQIMLRNAVALGEESDETNEDGGPGSGNFGHEGRPGEVGGSAPSDDNGGADEKKPPYHGLSEEGRSIIEAHKKNQYHFGESEEAKNANRDKLIKSLKDKGVEVEYIEEKGFEGLGYGYYKAVDPKMSLEENVSINAALQQSCFGSPIDREEYIKACRETGTSPRLHEEASQAEGWDLKTDKGKDLSDGTPVFWGLKKESILSDADLNKYAGFDEELSPDTYKKTAEAAEKAIESMSNDEKIALNNYTKQYGPGTYVEVNKLLATGEGSEATRKAASLIETATDHPIGANCLTSRGARAIHGTSNDEAAMKIVAQVMKGNFTKAGKLKEMLEGKEFTNQAAMSTSPGGSTSKYGDMPIQMIFKTPANAKAVNISRLSAYNGGRSEIEKKLAATGFFGAMEYESEVLYHPGARYRIDKVHYSQTRDGKKKRGQVFLECTILTDNEDERDDGGPGSGNHGHKGVKGQVGGSAPSDSSSPAKPQGKSLKDFLPSKSYMDTPEFQRVSQAAKQAHEKEDASWARIKEIDEELKHESQPKPKKEWDDNDMLDDLLGRRPMALSEKGKQLKIEREQVWKEMTDASRAFTEAGDEMRELKRQARKEEIKDFHPEPLKPAQSADYKGFTLEETSNSYGDEYLRNGLGTICEMSPKEYLERCAFEIFDGATMESCIGAIDEDTARGYAKQMQEGTKFHLPYLNYKQSGQEGRHRAYAAYLAGIEKMPVLIIGRPPKNRFDSVYDEWLEINLKRFKDEDEEKAFHNYEMEGGFKPAHATDIDEIDMAFEDFKRNRKRSDSDDSERQHPDTHILTEDMLRAAAQDAKDQGIDYWITVNGTPVPIDEDGNMTGKVAEKINSTSNKGTKAESGRLKTSKMHPDKVYGSSYFKSVISEEEGKKLREAAKGKQPTTQKVSIADLKTDQEVNRTEHIQAMLDHAKDVSGLASISDSKPLVVKKDGEYTLLDGNTRTICASVLGESEIEADVIDLDDPSDGVKQQSAFSPKQSGYVTKYEDEYGSVDLADIDPWEQKDYWEEMNRDKLTALYKKERQEAKDRGEKPPLARDIVDREWYGSRTEDVTKDLHHIDDHEADEILYNAMDQSSINGWFRNADSIYKPRIVNSIISSPETRNAALSIMYDNYRQLTDGSLSFEDFLTTPVAMYRGGHGQKHLREDIFSAYSFSRDTAEKFAGFEGRVYEAKIRPIDTWGSITTNKESEIMVPSWIAPNGNVDHADAKDDEDWVTINGTHVLIDDEGVAQGGGKLKGKKFSEAKSSKKSTSKSSSSKAEGFNKRIADAYKKNGGSEVGRETRAILKELPNGATVEFEGITYKKVGEDKFEYRSRFSGDILTQNLDDVAKSLITFDANKAPKFDMPKGEAAPTKQSINKRINSLYSEIADEEDRRKALKGILEELPEGSSLKDSYSTYTRNESGKFVYKTNGGETREVDPERLSHILDYDFGDDAPEIIKVGDGKTFKKETSSESHEKKPASEETVSEQKSPKKVLGENASFTIFGSIQATGSMKPVKIEKDGEIFEIYPNGNVVYADTGELFSEKEARKIIAGSTLSDDNPPEFNRHVEFADATNQKINRIEELKRKLDTTDGFEMSDADEYSKLTAEVRKEAREHFKTPDDCLTSSDAAWYLSSREYFQQPDEWNDYRDENDIGEFRGFDASFSKDCISAIDGIFTDYPMLKGKLGGFRADDDVSDYDLNDEYAVSRHGFGVVFSNDYGASKVELDMSYDHCVSTGFHPKGTSGAKAIIEHEYAHQIQSYISDELGRHFSSIADEIAETAAKRLGKTIPEVASGISQYALKNHDEMIAEAWAEYRCSKNPRSEAKMIGEIFEQYFGGGKK